MLSSNGKEVYCAAISCQKTRQVISINYLLVVGFIACEVG